VKPPWRRRLLLLGCRLLVALVVALLFFLLPLPIPLGREVRLAKDALVALILVCFLGKLLYDTLFYDHYWP